LVFAPADSAMIRAYFECDKQGKLYLSEIIQLRAGKHVKPRIVIKDSLIEVECIVDSIGIYVLMKDRYETKETTKTEIKEKTLIEKIRHIPLIYKILAVVGLAALLFVGIRVFIKKIL